MNRKSFVNLLFFSILITAGTTTLCISCNNSSESKLVYNERDTIKEQIKEKGKNITWTSELEGNILSEKITRNQDKISSNIPYTVDILKISPEQKKIYPELSDFGSLDSSLLKGGAKEKLVSFCNSLSENKEDTDSYFNGKYLFSYIFFKDDLKNGWVSYFSSDYPELNSGTLFSKYLVGEPFVNSDILQVPVRFFCNFGVIDVTIYMNPFGSNEFYQITIDRWIKK